MLSLTLRVIAALAPPGVAFVVSLLLSRIFVAPHQGAGVLLWWVLMSAVTLGVMFGLERTTRRLLPLAALLNLSMLFPDRAPARYKVARMWGRPKDLERKLASATDPESAETVSGQTVLELVAGLSVHDRRTRGHSERVRIFADLIGEQMQLPQHEMDRLRWAAMLHDIGKLRVPATLLNKPGKPTSAEWRTLMRHPIDGAGLIQPVAAWLGPWAEAVEHHHERYDGTGYPHRLHGERISLGGRIVAVADSYETMTAARPYKRPMSPTSARKELVRCAGAQFDPVVVRAFLNISIGRLWRTVGFSAVLSQVPLLPQVSSGLTRVGAQMTPTGAATGAAAAIVSVSGVSSAAASFTLAKASLPGGSPAAHVLVASASDDGSAPQGSGHADSGGTDTDARDAAPHSHAHPPAGQPAAHPHKAPDNAHEADQRGGDAGASGSKDDGGPSMDGTTKDSKDSSSGSGSGRDAQSGTKPDDGKKPSSGDGSGGTGGPSGDSGGSGGPSGDSGSSGGGGGGHDGGGDSSGAAAPAASRQ